MRERSTDSFETNSSLSMEALDAIFEKVEKLEEWRIPGPATDVLARRREILKREFRWDEDNPSTDPDDIWRNLKDGARARHRQHFGQSRGTSAFHAPSE